MRRIIILIVLLLGTAYCEAQRCEVTDFGAKGDGVTVNTRCLQAAIDSAHAYYLRTSRMAEVDFPEGTFVSGSLYLRTGVTIHLDSGAVLMGSTNPFDYVRDSVCRLMSFIFAVRQHNIGICGRGTIDGRGWEVANNMVNYIHLGLVKDPLKYDRPNEGNRPQLIHFRECDKAFVTGVTLKNPANWCQEYDRCRDLTIDCVKVDAKCYWNNDGLDVVDCQNVTVKNCYIDASDDAYCFKSHSVDGLSENILVEDCVGRSSANGIKFGTVTRGTMRHFRFKNITIKDTYRSAITIASVDGAHIEDIEVDGLRSIHTGNPFFLRFSSRNHGKVEPCVKDITIRNVYAEVPLEKPDKGYNYEGPVEDLPRNISPSSIVGIPGMRIENVVLENVEIVYPGHADTAYAYRGTTPEELAAIPEWEKRYPEFSMWKELPAWGLYMRHADGVTLRHVTFRCKDEDYRPAIVTDDVTKLKMEDVTIDQPTAAKRKRQVVKNSGGKLQSQSAPLTSEQILAQDNTSDCTQGKTLYKASMFGCKSNGTTLNTGSIQYAIDYIAAQGGGTLVFEVGRYLTGSIHLRAGVSIQLNEGAILVGSTNPYDYDASHQLIIYPPEGTSKICGLGFVQEVPGLWK